MFTNRHNQQRDPSSRAGRLFAALATAGLVVLFVPMACPARTENSGIIDGIRLDNGAAPFAGDRSLLTTITPNGDGFRDRARIHFRLAEPSKVTLAIANVPTRRLKVSKS